MGKRQRRNKVVGKCNKIPRSGAKTLLKEKAGHLDVNGDNSIRNAFRKAARGRLCPICNQRVEHAVYQRHISDCKIHDKDDDVIFCGIVQSTSYQNMKIPRNRNQIKDEEHSSILVEKISQTNSPQIGPETSSSLQEQISEKTFGSDIEPPANEGIARINEMSLIDVYELCLHSLEKFLGHYQSISNTQSLQWSQKRGEVSQPHATQLEHFDENFSYSQQMHKSIEESSGNLKYSHYALRIFWKIIQKGLLSPEYDNLPENAVKFWGESLRILLKFLSLSVDAQKLFVLLLRRHSRWFLVRDTQERYHDTVPGDHTIYFEQLCTAGVMKTGSTMENIELLQVLRLLKRADFLVLCKKFHLDSSGERITTLIDRFLKLGEQKAIFGVKLSQIILKSIRTIIGEFYIIDINAKQLFTAFFTIYSPTYMDTSQLLEPQFNDELHSHLIFTVLQFENEHLSFPSPLDCAHSLIGVLGSFDVVMDYIEAKHFEEQLALLLNKQPPEFDKALKYGKEAKTILLEKYLGDPSKMSFYRSLPIYHRRFTAPWVLVRCLFRGGVEIAQRLKDYELAVGMLKFLVENDDIQNFCINQRGMWYERLALNLERYLKDVEQSAHFCHVGIEDFSVRDADKLNLQNRLIRLQHRLKKDVSTNSHFIRFDEPEKVEIHGTTLGKGIGDGNQVNHFYVRSNSRDEMNKCSVEALALHHFLTNEGFTHGYHTEGGIWHTLFRLFFNDIIFDVTLPKIWLSRLQDDPLDLNFADFYQNRKAKIDQRLEEVHSAGDLLSLSLRYYEQVKLNVAPNSIISWLQFSSIEELTNFVRCCSPVLLHDLFKKLCLDYAGSRSGFPDLTIWSQHTSSVAVVEVKGPHDSLSTKQQLWLHFFRSHGIRAVVCHVAAKNDRALS